jgi:hypothetical protein
MTRRKGAMSVAALELSRTELKKYNPTEDKLFSILRAIGIDNKINTESLTAEFYGKDIPFNGRTIISGCVNAFIKKIEWNKAVLEETNMQGFERQFQIRRSERAGPNSTEVWLARRPKPSRRR